MSWRAQLHPIHSKAEWDIYQDLKKAGFRTLMMDMTVKLTKILDEEKTEFLTFPDYYYGQSTPSGYRIWLVYLDGPPHLKKHVEERDDVVKACAEAMGYKVLRYPYKAPLSPQRGREIITEILKNFNSPEREIIEKTYCCRSPYCHSFHLDCAHVQNKGICPYDPLIEASD